MAGYDGEKKIKKLICSFLGSKENMRWPILSSSATRKAFLSPLYIPSPHIHQQHHLGKPKSPPGGRWGLCFTQQQHKPSWYHLHEICPDLHRQRILSLETTNDYFMFKLRLMVLGGRWLRCTIRFPPQTSCLRHPVSAIKLALLYCCRNLFFMSLFLAWWFLVQVAAEGLWHDIVGPVWWEMI